MHVHFLPPIVRSRALTRIERSLIKYAPPNITAIASAEEADLVIVPIVGRRDQIRHIVNKFRQRKQRYVMAQYVLRSTQRPITHEWIDIWNRAHFVWSYYDLPAWCEEDQCPPDFRFYRSPLGVEDIFHAVPFTPVHDRPALILSSGRSWLTESVRECVRAAERVNKIAWHLGTNFEFDPFLRNNPGLRIWSDVSDEELITIYQGVQYVSGLRRIEGFELPAAEGLLCGARPVMFDKPHYRDWFGSLAEYIPEINRDTELQDLIHLFEQPYRPVTLTEIDEARVRFAWEPIATQFWQRCIDD